MQPIWELTTVVRRAVPSVEVVGFVIIFLKMEKEQKERKTHRKKEKVVSLIRNLLLRGNISLLSTATPSEQQRI